MNIQTHVTVFFKCSHKITYGMNSFHSQFPLHFRILDCNKVAKRLPVSSPPPAAAHESLQLQELLLVYNPNPRILPAIACLQTEAAAAAILKQRMTQPDAINTQQEAFHPAFRGLAT